jgi:hypothetical protein
MAIDLNKLNLRKESIINLKKEAGIGKNSKAQVVSVVDYSGSMSHLYEDGTVQDTVERILPLGLAFDDDGSVDSYLFHHNYKELPAITTNNLDRYVNEEFMRYSMGMTSYAPVLNAIKSKFAPAKTGGILGFGGTAQPMEYPVYIIFIVDGGNDDPEATEKVIKEMSELGFFIQFIGIGNASFSFLEKLDDLPGRKLDNANFFKVSNIKNMSDNDLYKGLMTEYPGWLIQAKDAKLVK